MNFKRFFNYIAFGFIFIVFSLNINNFDLLPNWIGYLLIYLAIKDLNLEIYKQSKLDILLIIFMIYHIVNWIFTINIPIINIVMNITNIYVNYMILNCLIECCKMINQEEESMTKYRDIQLVLDIIITVGLILNSFFINEFVTLIALIVAFIAIVLRVIIICKCFALSKVSEN